MISDVPSDFAPPSGAGPLTLRSGFGTDRGLRRELNEDSFIAQDPVFAVADGMGGHEAGEVASGICVRTLAQRLATPEGNRDTDVPRLQRTLQEADQAIRLTAGGRAGTTLSGVVVVEQNQQPYWLVFNVGDARTYRLSRGAFAQVTVDHSEVQELIDDGSITPSQALRHPRRHVVTRALGSGDGGSPDYWLLPIEDGDRIMVCSDGLTGEVSDEFIHQVLRNAFEPQEAVNALIQAALRNGGRDNVSVVVVDAFAEDGELTTSPRIAAETEDTLPREQLAPAGDQDPGSGETGEES
ncbi:MULTISPECIES: protein phosphatase 2C domain-containing protein [Arthrobacter]|uniref:Protein phosphatase 2C domain-containing protein n=2 Tax=Arthrobacter TaxID=1663 RepID=A0ABU9KQN4_9MICC|nr:protein phosphatase 2C domain-containing protein [Arthrobacter sp. YJM1]MDP5228329.1 protein phosphatase 2C domain-containing protein [Arthrobacter sp. YJM1]